MKFDLKFSQLMFLITICSGILSIILLFNLSGISGFPSTEPMLYEGYWTGITGSGTRDNFDALPIKGVVFEVKYEANKPFTGTENVRIHLISYKTWNPNISIITINHLTAEILFADQLQNIIDFQVLHHFENNITLNLELTETDQTILPVTWIGHFPQNTKSIGIKLIASLEVKFNDGSRMSFSNVDIVRSTPNILVENEFFYYNYSPFLYVLTIAIILSFIGSLLSWRSPSVTRVWFLLIIAAALGFSTLVVSALDYLPLPPIEQNFQNTSQFNILEDENSFQIDSQITLENVRVDELYSGSLIFNLTFNPNIPLRGFVFEIKLFFNRGWFVGAGFTDRPNLSPETIWSTEKETQFITTFDNYIASNAEQDIFRIQIYFIAILNNGTAYGNTYSGRLNYYLEDSSGKTEEFLVTISPSLNPLKLLLFSATFIITIAVVYQNLSYLNKKFPI